MQKTHNLGKSRQEPIKNADLKRNLEKNTFYYALSPTYKNDLVLFISTLLKSQKQEIIGIAKELKDYADHDKDCILSGIEAGRPTSNGGYEMKIGGKWYQTRPVDKTPKCDCGLSDIIEKLKEMEEGR